MDHLAGDHPGAGRIHEHFGPRHDAAVLRARVAGPRWRRCAVPRAAAGHGRRRRRRLPRLGTGNDVDPDGPRAVQPDAQPVAGRPPPPDQRRAGRGPAVRLGRRALVRDPVRTRRDHRLVPVARIPPPDRDGDARRARRLPGDEGRRLARRRAGQDPPRAPDRGDGRRRGAAAHALLRLGRLDAALADPVRGDLRLDRGPRLPRPALAERPGGPRVDRSVRRSRRRRVRRVRAAVRARARQPGLEGLRGLDPEPDRRLPDHADRAGRGPGLRLRCEAADGRPGGHA